jgi:hypothetical protein
VFLTTGTFAQNTFPASGNVGIGTTAPTDALSVNGDMDIGARLKFDNPNAFGGNSVVFGLNGSSGNKRFLFYDYLAGSPLMVVNDGASGGGVLIGSGYISSSATPDAAPPNGLAVQGNVGIGTSSPGALLDVEGSFIHSGLMSTTAMASPGVTSGIVSYFGTSSPLVAWDAITAQVTNPSTANGTIYNGYSSTPAINVTDGTSRIVIGGAFAPSLVATGGSTSAIYGVNSNATLGSPSATGGYHDLYGGVFSAGTSPTAPTATTVANVAGIKSGVQIDSGSVGITRGLL